MAEALALGIPGMFLACVQYFTLVQLGRNFTADFGSSLLQLRSAELRFQRWGEAAGITDERSETFVKQLQDNHTPQEIEFAHSACTQILKQLQKAHEESESVSEKNGDSEEELKVIDELEQLEISGPETKRANSALEKLKSRYQSGKHTTAKLVVRSKWALYKKAQLDGLLRTIGEHVSSLETLFPQQERALAAQEAAELEREDIKELTALATNGDPLFAEALREEARRKGFSWNNIEIGDYVTAHLGDHYREAPQNEGPHTYSNIKTSGHAVVHAGNTYGFETPPDLRSAFAQIPRRTDPGSSSGP